MFPILLDHDAFVVINKPPGIGMHREGDEPGLVQLASEFLGRELLPVHRLDKVTSGALILAKTVAANRELAESFARRQVEKYYLALSQHRPNKKQGLVAGDLERSRRGSWKLVPSMKIPAVTQFFSGALEAAAGVKPLRWFLLKPATGKTHQIRVALKSLGSPVLGDPLYARESLEEADRAYLHAWALRFSFQGERFAIMAPPQPGLHFETTVWSECLTTLNPPWQMPWPQLPSALLRRIRADLAQQDEPENGESR